ncbi:hypothetical protein PHSC3_000453 [Chlamydiales bacterium STE3]|nr:hypothetical protein PHSC3_000453 [Chlamydiales bacterium STE3]
MAGLFILFASSLLAIFLYLRKLAITLICTSLALTIIMFFYHSIEALRMNW